MYAALPSNAKCAKFFTPEIDGLKQTWSGTCWMNPPYGREIERWVKKAFESAQAGATVVCLLPANGHGMVARLRSSRRSPIPPRPPQVRQREERGAVPLGDCGFSGSLVGKGFGGK